LIFALIIIFITGDPEKNRFSYMIILSEDDAIHKWNHSFRIVRSVFDRSYRVSV